MVYTLRALSRGRNRYQGNEGQPRCTHRKSTHTLGNRDTPQQPARDSEGELPAVATAPPPPPPLLLVLCCCCAAAASRPAMHRGAQPVTSDCFSFVFFGTHAGASNGRAAAAAAAAGPATGEAKTYVRVYYWTSGGVMIVSTIFFIWPLLSFWWTTVLCCDSCAKKGLPCCRRLRRHCHHRRRCCFCCAAAVVTYGHLFSVVLRKYAVLHAANRSFLLSIRYLYFFLYEGISAIR